ncbi:GL13998 [Drosophila persimilis]|uniref:GL13998 n=1 Tax=Drosophila persimilis TaxID=7234 RepID=B4GND3_DROPE|nr:GL13998 [Drosophila persimilis]
MMSRTEAQRSATDERHLGDEVSLVQASPFLGTILASILRQCSGQPLALATFAVDREKRAAGEAEEDEEEMCCVAATWGRLDKHYPSPRM